MTYDVRIMQGTASQQEALALFAKAAQLQPATIRFAYVYGVALHSYGEVDKAIAVHIVTAFVTMHPRKQHCSVICPRRSMGIYKGQFYSMNSN